MSKGERGLLFPVAGSGFKKDAPGCYSCSSFSRREEKVSIKAVQEMEFSSHEKCHISEKNAHAKTEWNSMWNSLNNSSPASQGFQLPWIHSSLLSELSRTTHLGSWASWQESNQMETCLFSVPPEHIFQWGNIPSENFQSTLFSVATTSPSGVKEKQGHHAWQGCVSGTGGALCDSVPGHKVVLVQSYIHFLACQT